MDLTTVNKWQQQLTIINDKIHYIKELSISLITIKYLKMYNTIEGLSISKILDCRIIHADVWHKDGGLNQCMIRLKTKGKWPNS